MQEKEIKESMDLITLEIFCKGKGKGRKVNEKEKIKGKRKRKKLVC